ncbi:4-amino-5-hydroxymethyl-2-methylpyrimidine-phosphate synthase [Syntrophotalea carbinolica DSM 2380]|uniref:Phosphomethylpyrimidine synthase 2 n=1 Tax=Syntrophotalea carbinolica (strain DSM 2380 / NBRC 103641 / GraBd1) TaxID=338963 RepID=THIC2_SYNC1|nr:phosphomethylpyrimidine synthase ThiC [Syntrophotalea carbinolica]Q3A2D2.1 RecName: Full=Phosphomethylpyrimidine synthase 2; AltName: Full=Hydroxymethylpyrimidine phosphate synthase 2; Short=HMP-P synthase 2; Short=HMP-phosphate synthase 2; Short=HMPP synthase 2; AltName: Full=Thiamine biosynthesis protein ThiC 2 [Syntrophotalea carbinolica DSM 2380]ABA89475.1 4-amino-5-hydroxymethyl-2-methylpyrimidine-phosphate synthase [Syntrophotalea carbinolica DSM 2380]
MTQLEMARQGIVSDKMKQAAADAGIDAEILRQRIAEGTAIVCHNNMHANGRPLAVGKGLPTRVNANIGTSKDDTSIDNELEKARVAVAAGADAIMDLSTGGPIDEIRRAIIAETQACIGSVPLYQAACDTVVKKGKAIVDMTADEIFDGIKKHLDDGVDFITVHCGVTLSTVERMDNEGRIMDVVSRGGSFTVAWMTHNNAENPLYEQYDRLLELVKPYDATLSLGDGFRPGCLADATDRAQIHELIILGELTQRAWDAGIQVMIEGPGHVPLNQIEANIQLQKSLCHGAPFYVLGPLVTDIAPGYDHITCAIGGAVAAGAGADFLCYVTPSEHLCLPNVQDVHDGVMATRIAAHAADIVKGLPGAMEKDIAMSKARKGLDWETQYCLAIDPELARKRRGESGVDEEHGACTMCGEFCAYKVMDERKPKQ